MSKKVRSRYQIILLLAFILFVDSCASNAPVFLIAENSVPPIIYVTDDGSGDFNCDGKDDQLEINAALDFVAGHSEYTTVYLKGPATYWIDDSIYISSDTVLEGDENAVVKLVDHAFWWKKFKPLIGQKGTVFELGIEDGSIRTGNITIRGFELNGNRANQSEPSGHSYYRMIQLQNCYNITINDMYIHSGLADGILTGFLRENGPVDINSRFYNNRIHNDGHDGIYVGNAVNFEIHDNIITNTRTDASIRVQNCNQFKIYNNIAGNAPDRRISGVAAVHVISYGNKALNDAEIYNNYFFGNQNWHGIWLERLPNGGEGSLDSHTGVYIHHNVISQYRLAGIGIYGFNNTRIENNVIEISVEESGITFYKGSPGNSISGFQTFLKNNIIIKNAGYGIDNRQPAIHRFISDHNCINGNSLGTFNNAYSVSDIYTDPLLACEYEFHERYYNATSYYILSPAWKDSGNEEDSENPANSSDLGANEAWTVYHLRSEAGRWNGINWVKDILTSPCIDTGDPEFDYSSEPSPNGERVNIGAFGNTQMASMSD
ncbi:MAG: right-handed parallel beta-helix repeat-containing protein [Spirochaetaceae bacterium]|nr:right-handed parallel beta-helix repeat-containing protein [Spirochaetaceae bacterium]